MRDLLFEKQCAELAKASNYLLVGLEYLHPGEKLDLGSEVAAVVDRTVARQGILLADHEVVIAVARCRVDSTRTGIEGHVISKHEKRFPVDEGMACLQTIEPRSVDPRNLFCPGPAKL